jgi:site-specific recombinase XerD
MTLAFPSAHLKIEHSQTRMAKKMDALEKVKREMIFRHMAKSSIDSYLYWIRKFKEYHSGRPPEDMGTLEVKNYLEHLALSNKVVASTQNQAFSALLFLYREVLGLELTGLDNTLRAKDSIHVPVVLSHSEVAIMFSLLRGTHLLMAQLIYGGGLRISECIHLRIKDLDFVSGQLLVKQGKGKKDRITFLPDSAKEPLIQHLEKVKA